MSMIHDDLPKLGRPAFDKIKNDSRCRPTVTATFKPMPIKKLTAVDGKLNAAEYQAALDQLGIDRIQAAKWLGFTPRHSLNLASGYTEVKPLLGKLLTLMLRLGIKPDQV